MSRADLPASAVADVERFCAARTSDDVRLEVETHRGAISIVERRPPWRPDDGAEWTSMPIAQLRFDGKAWTLFRPRASGRWIAYDGLGAASDPGPLLAEIEADPDRVFWG